MSYYEILDVEKTASADDIKKSYRKLAMKYHPDKNGGDDTKFKQIQEAYSVLGDQSKRDAYDMESRFHSGSRPNGQSGFSGWGMEDIMREFFNGDVFRPSGRHVRDFESFRGSNDDFDFAEAHYNQDGSGNWKPPPPKNKKGSDLKITISIHPEDTITGVEQKIRYKRDILCNVCNGDPNFYNVCDECNGDAFLKVQKDITIKVPPGCTIGTSTKIEGYGNQGTNGIYGDLIIEVGDVVSSERFSVGHNYRIETTSTIDLISALSGTIIEIDTLEGPYKHEIVPINALYNNLVILEDLGIPVNTGSERRTPHVHIINIEAPEITKELLDKFKNIKEYLYEEESESKDNSGENRKQGDKGTSEEQENNTNDS